MRSVLLIIAITATLQLTHTAEAQILEIRGAGCIGPCGAVTCCGAMVSVNENGVGLGRNFDCGVFFETAPSEQVRAFCSLLHAQGLTCMDAHCPSDDETMTQTRKTVEDCVRGVITCYGGGAPPHPTLKDALPHIGDVEIRPRRGNEESSAEVVYIPPSAHGNPQSIDYAVEVIVELTIVEAVKKRKAANPEISADLTPEKLKREYRNTPMPNGTTLYDHMKKIVRDQLNEIDYLGKLQECLEKGGTECDVRS